MLDGLVTSIFVCIENVSFQDVLTYLMELELRYEWPKVNCLQKQTHLTSDMRSVLVDWLVSVAGEYQMSNQTLHLTVNYIDRFISKMLVVCVNSGLKT